jgi:hypothetical protein
MNRPDLEAVAEPHAPFVEDLFEQDVLGEAVAVQEHHPRVLPRTLEHLLKCLDHGSDPSSDRDHGDRFNALEGIRNLQVLSQVAKLDVLSNFKVVEVVRHGTRRPVGIVQGVAFIVGRFGAPFSVPLHEKLKSTVHRLWADRGVRSDDIATAFQLMLYSRSLKRFEHKSAFRHVLKRYHLNPNLQQN